jgi:formate-dependent nitrite reductase membrane component NrfD
MNTVLEPPPEAVSSQEFPPANAVARLANPELAGQPGYYGLPLLKPPRWKWEIALYFFFEGVSAGSFVLAAMADLFGRGRHRELVRRGRYLAFLTLLPCPPLLIADLGRPKRFHHMLRIVKRTSPMNTGAWALTGCGAFAALLASRERGLVRHFPARTLSVLGLPFAITMLAYPGVLLSATSNPVWARTPFLGALFGCSSFSAARAALALAAPDRALARIEKPIALCEAAALAAYLATAGRAAKPLTRGRQSRQFWLGAVACGLVLPVLLRRRSNRGGTIGSLLTLGGALLLKWAITYAGRSSALDPEAARIATRPSLSAPGWREAPRH